MLSALKGEEMGDTPKFQVLVTLVTPGLNTPLGIARPMAHPTGKGLPQDWTEAGDLISRLKKLGSEGRWQDVVKLFSSVCIRRPLYKVANCKQ